MTNVTKKDVLKFIDLCRKTFGPYDDFSGGCYKFHLLLNQAFEATGYYNGDHVISMIGRGSEMGLYDIDGEFKGSFNDYYMIGGTHYPESFIKETFKEYL